MGGGEVAHRCLLALSLLRGERAGKLKLAQTTGSRPFPDESFEVGSAQI